MRNQTGVVLLALCAAACGKAAPIKAAADSSATAKTAMANMPGMPNTAGTQSPPDTVKSLKEIMLTPQQVDHGGVRWAPVIFGRSAGVATLPGALTANEDRTARLGAPARGRVMEVHVQPGDIVEQGRSLVTLQSAEAGMAQADASKAAADVTAKRAQAQYAASARARAERLLALKAIPRQDYERAIADDEQARASLTQAEAELRRAQNAAEQMGSMASVAGEIALRAPRAGVVLERMAVPGAVVEAGAPLVVVTDPATLWLRVNAPEQFAPLFSVGGELRFAVPAYPGETFTARIDAVSPGLDRDTRTLGVRGVVASRGKLKAEMLATVTVNGGPAVQAALVPEDAVQLMDGHATVFLVRTGKPGGTTFERRAVEVGARSGGRIAVTRGLAAGDVVVTAGAFAVKAVFQKGAMPKMEM